ncbi:unnamed protein product [Calypogeia fissa]
MTSIKDMDPIELGKFLMTLNLAEEKDAKKFRSEDVDGEILLGMSREQVQEHLDYSFGKAMRLVKWLTQHEIRAVAISKQVVVHECVVVEHQIEHKPNAVLNLCSSNSSKKGENASERKIMAKHKQVLVN